MKSKDVKKTADEMKIVFVAGMGMSPAVLTETVWALAHQKPSIVPNEIVVITTSTGKKNLQRDVMESGVWKQMCEDLRKEKIDVAGKLVLGSTSLQVIPDAQGNEIDDLRTGEDNLRAADFMLKTLRQYTDSSDTVVLASIAGGRKTMSALLLSCMTLVGRPEDKVYHVLTVPQFEGRMDPPFFYPKKGVTYKNAKGEVCKCSHEAIELFEVPFVRMGGVYKEKYKKSMPSYQGLVNQVQSSIAHKIEIDAWNGRVTVDGQPVRLGAADFAALLVVVRKRKADLGEIYKCLYRLKNLPLIGRGDWAEKLLSSVKFAKSYDEDWREAHNEVMKVLSSLRKKLSGAGVGDIDALVPQHNRSVAFPEEKIVVVNDEKIRAMLDKACAS